MFLKVVSHFCKNICISSSTAQPRLGQGFGPFEWQEENKVLFSNGPRMEKLGLDQGPLDSTDIPDTQAQRRGEKPRPYQLLGIANVCPACGCFHLTCPSPICKVSRDVAIIRGPLEQAVRIQLRRRSPVTCRLRTAPP